MPYLVIWDSTNPQALDVFETRAAAEVFRQQFKTEVDRFLGRIGLSADERVFICSCSDKLAAKLRLVDPDNETPRS